LASAVDATWVEPGGGDEVRASNAGALCDRISQRSNGIVPHELRKERQFALLLGRAPAKSAVPLRLRLAPQSSHDRQSLTRKFSEWRIVPSLGWEMRDEL
jgi:hypothetical protein